MLRVEFQMVNADLRRVAILLEALTVLDLIWLRDHPLTPHPYRAGIRYIPEDGSEEWPEIPFVIARGGGDCEDLAAWLAAYYRANGWPHAVAFPIRSDRNPRLYHCLVSRDGTTRTVEDPSAELGAPRVPPDDLARALDTARSWLARSCAAWNLPRAL